KGLTEGERVIQNPEKLKEKKRSRSSEKRGKDQDFKDKPPKDAPVKPLGPGVKPLGPGGQPGPGMKDGKPAVGPKGPPQGGNGGSGGFNMTPEQRAQMLKKWKEATPAQRKAMLQQIPADFRDQAKQGLKAQGIDIPD